MNPIFIDFIVKHTHLKIGHIKPEMRLAKDMGLYGLDAIAFFESFFAELEISNTENFDSDLYIDGGPDFAPRPLNWLKYVVNQDKRKYLNPDVTLGHLDQVVEKGIWFNER